MDKSKLYSMQNRFIFNYKKMEKEIVQAHNKLNAESLIVLHFIIDKYNEKGFWWRQLEMGEELGFGDNDKSIKKAVNRAIAKLKKQKIISTRKELRGRKELTIYYLNIEATPIYSFEDDDFKDGFVSPSTLPLDEGKKVEGLDGLPLDKGTTLPLAEGIARTLAEGYKETKKETKNLLSDSSESDAKKTPIKANNEQVLFDEFKKAHNIKRRTTINSKEKPRVREALKTYSVEELLLVINKFAWCHEPWCKSEREFKYHTNLRVILDPNRIEKYLNLIDEEKEQETNVSANEYLFSDDFDPVAAAIERKRLKSLKTQNRKD